MIDSNEVMGHYGTSPLLEQVNEALIRAELGLGTLKWSDLVPLDQFHVRGLGATKELAENLKIEAGAALLDVGCGLGGPARFLAATYKCCVTGIDLSQPFIEVAQLLTERCGLAASVHFLRADALNLPFSEGAFDDAWTQHVAMNIADRMRFYREIHRVLKPGGRLAIYDVIAGDGHPLIFPVPWAREPGMSFLLSADEMRQTLASVGFVVISWSDTTEPALTWFTELQSRLSSAPPLSLADVMGPQFLEMARNLGTNLREGRVRLVQAIFQRQ